MRTLPLGPSVGWGDETCEGCADMEVETVCGPCHWGLRWSSLWGHVACEWWAENVVTHADPATEAFGGAFYGATKRVRGVPNWVWVTHAGGAIGAFGGAPYGATKRVRGVPNWV